MQVPRRDLEWQMRRDRGRRSDWPCPARARAARAEPARPLLVPPRLPLAACATTTAGTSATARAAAAASTRSASAAATSATARAASFCRHHCSFVITATAKQATPSLRPIRRVLGTTALHAHRCADGAGQSALPYLHGAGRASVAHRRPSSRRCRLSSRRPGPSPPPRQAARSSRRRPIADPCPGSAARCRRAPRHRGSPRRTRGHDVRVAVPLEARLAVEHAPAEDEHAARFAIARTAIQRICTESVDVKALADTDVHRSASAATRARAQSRSSGSVSLRFHDSPGTTTMRPPIASTSAASSVPVGGRGVGGAQHVDSERLRRLHRDQRRTVRCGHYPRAASTSLIVSVTATPGTAPAAPDSTARTTAANRSLVANGRAASWTHTISVCSGTAASPRRTDSLRLSPPATMHTPAGSAQLATSAAARQPRLRRSLALRSRPPNRVPAVRQDPRTASGRRTGGRRPRRRRSSTRCPARRKG